jgi:hypothetical protein
MLFSLIETKKFVIASLSAILMTTQTQFGGAGILPFSVRDNKVYFLFQKTTEGRKSNQLVDFGGARQEHENDPQLTAAREFSEETYGLFLSNNLEDAARHLEGKNEKEIETSEIVQNGTRKILQKLQSKQNVWMSRTSEPPGYVMYFVMIDYQPLDLINRIVNNNRSDNTSSRVRKQREFLWISSDQIRAHSLPVPLFPRVTSITNVFSIMNQIIETFERSTTESGSDQTISNKKK